MEENGIASFMRGRGKGKHVYVCIFQRERKPKNSPLKTIITEEEEQDRHGRR